MKINEIRDLSAADLDKKLAELKEELFNLRFQMATGQCENPMKNVLFSIPSTKKASKTRSNSRLMMKITKRIPAIWLKSFRPVRCPKINAGA